MNIEKRTPLFGETGGQHPLARFVDHRETYGAHIIERFAQMLDNVHTAVDIGAGSGRDLAIIKRLHPKSNCVAVEAGQEYARNLIGKVDQIFALNIEKDPLPFDNGSVDLIIANQVLEHTKEIFWIFHEVTRSLRIGGHFLVGVPNIASLHNRFLLLLGAHPTQHKLCSAHVRPFSKADTINFVEACYPRGYQLRKFGGSQFYPFPPKMARLLSNAFPTAAFSIFFLFQKAKPYTDTFASYPTMAHLETNFWCGSSVTGSQYRA